MVELVFEPDDVGAPVPTAAALARVHRHALVVADDVLRVAAHAPQAAVQLGDVRGARTLMHAVDVLGDDDRAGLLLLDLGHDPMPGVRLALAYGLPALVVEVPDFLGIALE